MAATISSGIVGDAVVDDDDLDGDLLIRAERIARPIMYRKL